MATETKTSVGTVEVRQTASNEIEIRLKPSDGQRASAIERRRPNAADSSKQYLDLIAMYRDKGMTLQAIADNLNSKGFTTPRGKAFAPATIAMYLKRI